MLGGVSWGQETIHSGLLRWVIWDDQWCLCNSQVRDGCLSMQEEVLVCVV